MVQRGRGTPQSDQQNKPINNTVGSSLSGGVIAVTLEKGVTQSVLMLEGPIFLIEQNLRGGMENTTRAVKSLNFLKSEKLVAQAIEVKASSSTVASDVVETVLEVVNPVR